MRVDNLRYNPIRKTYTTADELEADKAARLAAIRQAHADRARQRAQRAEQLRFHLEVNDYDLQSV